jgi:uncharacterized UPF0160 family protein
MCTKNITLGRFPGIKCANCIKAYHIKCVGASDELVENINSGSATWLCISCRDTSRRSVIDYTDPIAPNNPVMHNTLSPPENPTLHDVMAALTKVQKQLTDLDSAQQFMNDTMEELHATVSSLTKENYTINKKINKMETKINEYEQRISWLEANADIPNQQIIARNIVVCGLPSEHDDISGLFVNLTGKIGVKLSCEDIVSIEKMKHTNPVSNALKNAFIVTVKTTDMKNIILTNFRKKKSLFLDEIDVNFGKSRIILLHHFTKFQTNLYKEAKQFKAKFNFRFLWCSNNKILLRNLPDSEVNHIRSSCQLSRLHRLLSMDDSSREETTTDIPMSRVGNN